MRGASRDAANVVRDALQAAVSEGADTTVLADELFAVTGVLDTTGTLRRALADPTTDAEAKRQMVQRLFGGKVSEVTVRLLGETAAQRWSADSDMVATLDEVGVQAALVRAEQHGRLAQVEDELFRFERIVAGDPALTDALTNRQQPAAEKADLVARLLVDKAAPETVRLAQRAAVAPRGQKFGTRIERMLKVAADRRDQLTAVVTTATELDQTQRDRLASSLQQMYGKPVLVQVVVDPAVIGGLKVNIGDEVIDGTVARKLETARQHLAG